MKNGVNLRFVNSTGESCRDFINGLSSVAVKKSKSVIILITYQQLLLVLLNLNVGMLEANLELVSLCKVCFGYMGCQSRRSVIRVNLKTVL